MKFDIEWARNFIKKELNFNNIEVIAWNRTDCGTAYVETRQVKIPDPTTINRFLICLHEICHVSRQSLHKSMKVYEYEYDCEMYAIRVGLGLGLDIKDYEHRAKGYVMYCFCKAFNRNLRLDKANLDIIDWLGVDVNDWNKWDRAYVTARSGWKKWRVNFYNVQ